MDPGSGLRLASVALGYAPHEVSVAPDGKRAAVTNYGLVTQQTVGIPLLVFAITSPHKTWSQDFLANYIAINIQDELARGAGLSPIGDSFRGCIELERP